MGFQGPDPTEAVMDRFIECNLRTAENLAKLLIQEYANDSELCAALDAAKAKAQQEGIDAPLRWIIGCVRNGGLQSWLDAPLKWRGPKHAVGRNEEHMEKLSEEELAAWLSVVAKVEPRVAQASLRDMIPTRERLARQEATSAGIAYDAFKYAQAGAWYQAHRRDGGRPE